MKPRANLYLKLIAAVSILIVCVAAQVPTASLMIMDWERNSAGIGLERFYAYPPTTSPYTLDLSRNDPNFNGNARTIIWSKLKKYQYFGWIADLRRGKPDGFDAASFDALAFRVRLRDGEEAFEICLKSTDSVEFRVKSEIYIDPKSSVQEVKIPFRAFPGVDLRSLENVNFAFDRNNGITPKEGSITFDEVRFLKQ